MEKGILFFTLSVACLWLVLDELFGTKKVSGVAQHLTPSFNTPIDNFINGSLTKEEKEKGVQDAKDKIDKSDAIKTDDAKKAVKDLIDDIYLQSGGRVTS